MIVAVADAFNYYFLPNYRGCDLGYNYCSSLFID